MAVKCSKRQIEETDELSFLASAIKEGRKSRRRLQMQLAQPKTICEFGLPSIIVYSHINITVNRPVRYSGRFLRFIYLVIFPQNHFLQCVTELPTLQPALQPALHIVFQFLLTSRKFISCSRKQAVCA